MSPPHLSPRRWFWLLMAAGGLWAWAGWKWDGDPGNPRWMRSLQRGVFQIVQFVEIPPQFIFTLSREATTGVVRKIAFTPASSETGGLSAEDLTVRLHNLQNENAQLKAMLVEANSRLEALQHLQMIGIRPEDTVVSNVVSLGSGSDGGKLHIDKGADSGVATGDAIVAPLEQVALLGRVSMANKKDALVLLLTDPSSKVQAQILRPRVVPANTRGVMTDQIVTTRPCLVQGMGNNLMRSLDVDVQQGVAPQMGDLVCMTDPGWPAKTQYMVIGQIEKVAHREDQPLRYELTISPRIAATTQRTVVVLTKN